MSERAVPQGLPSPFADLEDLMDWALPTRRARNAKRYASSFEELQAFYQRMQPRIEEILQFLNASPSLTEDAAEQNLRALAMCLAEIGPAIEYFGAVEVPFGFKPEQFLALQDD